MAESKYFPGDILRRAVMYFEIKTMSQGQIAFSIDSETFRRYLITIGIRDTKESYGIINLKDGAHLIRGNLSSGHGLEKNNPWELENNLTILGEVTVKNGWKEIATFQDFNSFIKTIN